MTTKFCCFISILLQVFSLVDCQIHQEKYYCIQESAPSQSRVLVIGTNDKYLSYELLENVTGKVKLPEFGDKIYNFQVTLSGFLQKSQHCLTFIELPEVFEPKDMLDNLEQIKNRCFDHVVLAIDGRQKSEMQQLNLQLAKAQIQLLDLAYGPKLMKSLKVLILVKKEPTFQMVEKSRKFIAKLFEEFQHVPEVMTWLFFETKKIQLYLFDADFDVGKCRGEMEIPRISRHSIVHEW